MTIQDYKDYFIKEIRELYTPSETEFLFVIFVNHHLGYDRITLRNYLHEEISSKQIEEFNVSVEKLKTALPYQYILGSTEFYGRHFFVNENVLIPRPETEELIELTIEKIKKTSLDENNFSILDIGTGSGVIPILLKLNFPKAKVTSIDIDSKAIKVAKKNAAYHDVEINFEIGDYLHTNFTETFDLIISNPPYIGIDETKEINFSVKGFEPTIALFSPTSDALIFYKKIAKDGHKILSKNGLIILEINQKLGKETLELFNEYEYAELIKDLSNNDRLVFAQKSS